MMKPSLILFSVQGARNLGDALQILVLGRFLYDQTGSIETFGMLTLLGTFMRVGGSMVAGTFVDHISSRRLLLVVESVRGLVMCAVSLMLWRSYSFYAVLLMVLAFNFGVPFYKASFFKLQLSHVPPHRLLSFNGRMRSVFQGGQFLGMGLAGLLLSLHRHESAFFVSSLTFFLVVLFVTALPSEETRPLKKNSRPTGWRDVLPYIRAHPSLLGIVALSALPAVVTMTVNVILVPLVERHFHGSNVWLALLDALFALGAFLSGIVCASWIEKYGLLTCTRVSIGCQSLLFLTLFLSPVSALVGLFLLGVLNTASLIGSLTLMQRALEERYRGRFSLIRSMLIALMGGGALLLVTRTHVLGLSLVVACVVIVVFLISLSWFLRHERWGI